MTPPKKRKLLQLHLSTALTLMLIMAGMMFLQTIPTTGNGFSEFLKRDWRWPSKVFTSKPFKKIRMNGVISLYEIDMVKDMVVNHPRQKVVCYGWPSECMLGVERDIIPGEEFHFLSPRGIIKNTLLTTLILLTTAILCERRIRTSTSPQYSTKEPRT